VLALTVPAAERPAPAAFQGSVQMAATALERLDREINGGSAALARVPVSVRSLLDSAIGRWRARAEMAGGSLTLRREGDGAVLHGDRGELARALDNLIANAIEHGGPEIVVEAVAEAGRLRLAVIDSGHRLGAGSRRRSLAALAALVTGRRRRGHGLRVVRRAATAHGGEFRLRSSERGTEALLELPLAGKSGGGG
jgi:signal transduction histidine kinase